MINIIFSLFLLGLSFGSGPCLASCGPILISYVAGTEKNVLKSFISYILFSLARISVYLALGLLVFLLGRFVTERFLEGSSQYIFLLGGAFVICVGVLIVLGKRMDFGFCRFLHNHILEQNKKSVAMLGLIIGFLPCAPLLALFSYVGLISKSWVSVLLYIFSFGIGTFVSPLLVLVIFAGFIRRLLSHANAVYGRYFSFICGLIMIFLGIQLILRAF